MANAHSSDRVKHLAFRLVNWILSGVRTFVVGEDVLHVPMENEPGAVVDADLAHVEHRRRHGDRRKFSCRHGDGHAHGEQRHRYKQLSSF